MGEMLNDLYEHGPRLATGTTHSGFPELYIGTTAGAVEALEAGGFHVLETEKASVLARVDSQTFSVSVYDEDTVRRRQGVFDRDMRLHGVAKASMQMDGRTVISDDGSLTHFSVEASPNE